MHKKYVSLCMIMIIQSPTQQSIKDMNIYHIHTYTYYLQYMYIMCAPCRDRNRYMVVASQAWRTYVRKNNWNFLIIFRIKYHQTRFINIQSNQGCLQIQAGESKCSLKKCMENKSISSLKQEREKVLKKTKR